MASAGSLRASGRGLGRAFLGDEVMATALKFENLTLGYDRHPAVHHLNTSVEEGELLAIVGPNGGGKSTLLKGIMGQLRPLQGGIHCAYTRDQVAYLPQRSAVDLSFPVTVSEMVAMGAWHETGAWGRFQHKHKVRIKNALINVGLKDYGDRAIGTLSGGQMQRALFARLLMQDADLILLDEPFNAIDTRTTDDLLRLIEHWRELGKTVIAVLHDMEQVRAHFPKTLMISRELIAKGDTQKVLTPENLNLARDKNTAFDSHADVCQAPAEFYRSESE